MRKTTLRKVGGSTVVAIPPALLSQLGLKAGSRVAIRAEGGRLVVDPGVKPHYTLKELFAQCDFSIPPSEEEQEWLNSPPVGREII